MPLVYLGEDLFALIGSVGCPFSAAVSRNLWIKIVGFYLAVCSFMWLSCNQQNTIVTWRLVPGTVPFLKLPLEFWIITSIYVFITDVCLTFLIWFGDPNRLGGSKQQTFQNLSSWELLRVSTIVFIGRIRPADCLVCSLQIVIETSNLEEMFVHLVSKFAALNEKQSSRRSDCVSIAQSGKCPVIQRQTTD